MELCWICEGKGYFDTDNENVECENCLGDGFLEEYSPLTFIKGKQNRRKLGDEEEMSLNKKEVKK